MNPVHIRLFIHFYERACQASTEVSWCCSAHHRLTVQMLVQMEKNFVGLHADDDAGLMQCLDDASAVVDNLETLAVLTHPAINVTEVGMA